MNNVHIERELFILRFIRAVLIKRHTMKKEIFAKRKTNSLVFFHVQMLRRFRLLKGAMITQKRFFLFGIPFINPLF